MKICGIQKLSLLDFPNLLAATVFTGGCNLRCPFCHNANLVLTGAPEEIMSTNELLAFLEKRKGRLDGVCISGGEPTLHHDLKEFIQDIRALGYKIKLDTNGTAPDKLEELINEGLLDYVAMDIKNSPQKYPLTCGIENMDITNIKKSVSILLGSGIEYEFRTTVVKELHTVEDIQDIGAWIKGANRYYLQTFVDSGGLIAENLHPVAPEVMGKMRDIVAKYVENAEIRGQ